MLAAYFLVALAQPDWSRLASVLTAVFGYALFWRGVVRFQKFYNRFFLATVWFAAVHLAQIAWFAADRYVGGYIYFLILFLSLWTGAQFGVITLLIRKRLSWLSVLGIAGAFVLAEWVRLFFFAGYTFNPIGMALSATVPGIQIASLLGALGLTFWVMATNLLAFRRSYVWMALFALAPYLYGVAQMQWHKGKMEDHLNAVVVQSALRPELRARVDPTIEPLNPFLQWGRLIELVEPYRGESLDLILFSEAVVPYDAHTNIYPIEGVISTFQNFFGDLSFFPDNPPPFVSNAFWAETLAKALDADLIIGMEDASFDEAKMRYYNAAFHFSPHRGEEVSYGKRVLIPMAEYIPCQWMQAWAADAGIVDTYSHGTDATLFETAKVSVGSSICYEETFGHLMRESRQRGSELHVNLTNDVWYPYSRLPLVHFFHGRLLAVEQGVPLLRSCNTGVSCGVDSLGRLVGMLPYETKQEQAAAGALLVQLPLHHYRTLYTVCGDYLMVALSSLFVLAMTIQRIKP